VVTLSSSSPGPARITASPGHRTPGGAADEELGLGLEDAPGSRIAMTLKIRITAATVGISLAIAIALLERFL
jgi:hypothetical protein